MTESASLTRILVATAAVVVILAGIKAAAAIIVPFLLSLFIAIMCSPLIRFMTERKVPLVIAIGGVFVVIVLVFTFLAGLFSNAIQEFTASIPQYKLLLAERISTVQSLILRWNLPFTISRETILTYFDPNVMMNFVSRMLSSFSGMVSDLFVLLLIVVFMLLESPVAKYKLAVALSPDDDLSNEEFYIERVLDGVISYLAVKTFVSALTGLSIWLLLVSFEVQYAVLWAMLGFLLNYIPNIGSIIAAIPIVVQALLLNGFSVGLAVLIGVVAINMVIGNVLEPRMMGKKLGLSTVVVFLSLLFWGWMLGLVGMFLSVPLTMAIKIALESSNSTKRYAALLSDAVEIKR